MRAPARVKSTVVAWLPRIPARVSGLRLRRGRRRIAGILRWRVGRGRFYTPVDPNPPCPRVVGGLNSSSVSTIWTRNGERSGAHTWKYLSYFLTGDKVSFQMCHISVLPKSPMVSTAAMRSPRYPASMIPTEFARRILVLLMLDLG